MQHGTSMVPPKYCDPDSIIEFSEHKQLLCNDIRLVEQEITSVESLSPSTWQHACLLQTMETPAKCKARYIQQLRSTIRLRLERPVSVSPRTQAFKDDVEQLHADMLQVLTAGVPGIHTICFPRVKHADRLKPLVGFSHGGNGIPKRSATVRRRLRSRTSGLDGQ